ncbi:hypothetical protein HDU78_001463 [Chytriomyces hyalinus]|nr:hypothetical protein HDU78_001463 [Chytriomyces hyalinus]
MQYPTPKITNPEAPKSRRGSADEVSTPKPKTATSDLKAPLLTETSSPSRSTMPSDQDQDQVPDEQAETHEEIPTNPVAVTDQRAPVVDPVEAPQIHAPAPTTSAPTQNDPLDELVAGVELLQVQETEALQVQYEVVLRRDLDPNIPIVKALFSPRRNKLTSIPAPFAVVVTRNGVRGAYINIHKPDAYIEKARMNEAVF